MHLQLLSLLQGEVESLHGEVAQLTAGRAADKQHSGSLVAGLRQELQASQEAEQTREEELNDLANAREAVQSELAGAARPLWLVRTCAGAKPTCHWL